MPTHRYVLNGHLDVARRSADSQVLFVLKMHDMNVLSVWHAEDLHDDVVTVSRSFNVKDVVDLVINLNLIWQLLMTYLARGDLENVVGGSAELFDFELAS